VEIVGNEFVVAFEVEVGDVEKNRAVFFFGALAQDVDRTAVTFEERGKDGAYEGRFQNFGSGS
jgi:hypothetical protein